MRRVQLFIATSLDGYIARPDGDIGWLFMDADYGYTRFYAGVDTVILGRKTYDLCRTFHQWPYLGKEAIVLSRLLAGKRTDHARFVDVQPTDLVHQLRQLPGKHLWLVGGGEVTRDFLSADLIDDFILTVHPVVLGGGIPLFLPQERPTWLKLANCQTFPSGLVQIHYRRQRDH
jgi:dihydrofolate reductase